MNKKSLKRNAFYNGIRKICNVIFPLITFPYVSRILGVDSLGKYNFSNSIINYIILLAGLGISTYAIREGSKLRDDKEKLEKFVSQVFTINLISTLVSYIVLALLLFLPRISEYTSIILILSFQVIFTTIGVEWLYSVFEDYLYITIRSISFQIVSLILMFLFVKSSSDLIIYALISTIASTGSNILNFLYIKKYCNISLTKNIQLKNHLKPILILFASQIAITIYVSSDITILGLMKDDYVVGIYSVSVKIYSILKNLISAIVLVSIPRLAYLIGNNKKEEFNSKGNNIYKSLFTLCIPTIAGLILLSKEAILFIGGTSYLASQNSLIILAFAILFSTISYFWCQCVLVPNKEEKLVLYLTIISAIINILFNICFIPFLGEIAASITTLISEGFVCIVAMIYGKKYLKINKSFPLIIKVLIGCFLFIIVGVILKIYIKNTVMYIIVTVISSMFIYLVSQIFLKNECFDFITKKIKNYLMR